MANIADVGVRLVARTGQFEQGMLRAKKALGGFHKAAIAAIGIGSITQTVRSFGQVAGEIDKIQKLSQRLNISTEFLSEIRFAASQSGIEFEALATSMQRTFRRIGAASKGQGEAVEALKELGLDVEKLSRLKPEEQFLQLADAFHKMGGSQRGLVALAKIADTEGVVLAQMFKDGREGVENMMRAMRELGGTITNESANSVANFNDSIDKIITNFKVMSESGVTAFAKITEEATKSGGIFSDTGIGGRLANTAKLYVEDLKDGIGAVGATINRLWHGDVNGAMFVLKESWENSLEVSEKIEKVWSKTTDKIRQASNHRDEITFPVDNGVKAAQIEYERQQNARDVWKKALDLYKRYAVAAPTTSGQFGATNIGLTALNNRASVSGGKPQIVKDPNVETVIDVLRQILAKSGGARAA